MIDLNDKKIVILKSGRKVPRYKCLCDTCGCDRGYIDKNAGSKHNNCRSCANTFIGIKNKGIKRSEETRRKMSLSAHKRYNDPDWIAKKDKLKHTKQRVYKTWNSKEQIKIKHNIRTLLNQKLKRRGLTKKNKTFNTLGYSPDDLIYHLEKQFKDGMSWDNYGEWHIDHIKPDSWFNYKSTDDEEFKKSWALSNLQPLWARDNLSKNNRYSDISS